MGACHYKGSATYITKGRNAVTTETENNITFMGKTINIVGNDKLGIPNNVISQDDFLAKYGVRSPISSYSVDKYGGANRTRLSQRQREADDQKLFKEQAKYADKRQEVISEYNRLVSDGTLKKPTLLQNALRIAQGHSDNQSVQSARRIVEKQGYDWRTGKKKR